MKLSVPKGESPVSAGVVPGSQAPVSVQTGDTLASIAAATKTPLAKLAEANAGNPIIGAPALEQALTDPETQARSQTAIDAFNATDELDRLPVVMSPGRPTTGALKTTDALTRWLSMTNG